MKPLRRTYLDYNAGAPLLPAARDAMSEILLFTGNPSSIHAEGRNMRKHVEHARSLIADHLGCLPGQIIFTSGATEAANQALSPAIQVSGRQTNASRLYVAATEHPCVLSGGRFDPSDIETVPVFENGVIDSDALDEILARHDATQGAPLVGVMLANNETGVIQPIGKVGEIVRRHGGYLVVDAVQGLGKIEIDLAGLGADFVLLSAHKIGGPQGAGALVLGSKSVSPASLLTGGGQESYHRAGTENVAAIAGFGAAVAQLSEKPDCGEIRALRDSMEAGLRTISMETGDDMAEPVVFSRDAERLANTICFAVPGISAETALISLDLAGIAVSSGSACSSGKVRKSHVLAAMGVPDDLAAGALRISLGANNDITDSRHFLDVWKNIVRHAAWSETRVAV